MPDDAQSPVTVRRFTVQELISEVKRVITEDGPINDHGIYAKICADPAVQQVYLDPWSEKEVTFLLGHLQMPLSCLRTDQVITCDGALNYRLT